MDIKINFEIDITPRLEKTLSKVALALITARLGEDGIQEAVERQAAEPAKPQPEEAKPEVIKFESNEDPKPEEKVEEKPEPKVEEKVAEEPKAKPLTAQDCREAIQRKRNQFEYGTPAEGEEKGSNEEPDEKIHKALTAAFKEVIKDMGYNKMPEIPEDKRAEFISRISALQVNPDNTVTPF